MKQGLDLDKLVSKKRFTFVDGLTGLFLPDTANFGKDVLRSPGVTKVASELINAIQSLGDGKVALVIDGLDLLLAAGAGFTAVGLNDLLSNLREV